MMGRRWAAVALAVLAVLLTGAGLLVIQRSTEGVARRNATVEGVPVTVIRPKGDGTFPVVVVVHGYAGSNRIMRELATGLARAGYATVLPDLAGHGRNLAALPELGRDPDATYARLSSDLDAVVGWARVQPFAQPGLVSLVGHSMGAGAVTRFAADHPGDVRATVAISVPDADHLPTVADRPANLLLLVGSLESADYRAAALEGLRAAYPDGVAGRRYGDPATGTAREIQVVPRVEHIGIVLSSDTMRATQDWLDAAAGIPSRGSPRPAGLPLAALLLTLAGAVGFAPVARVLLARASRQERRDAVPGVRILPGRLTVALAAGGAAAATLLLALVPSMAEGLEIPVAGYLGWWFATVGVATAAGWAIAVGDPAHGQPDPGPLALPALALTAFSALSIAGVAHLTWANAVPVGPRRWIALLLIPTFGLFFLGDGLVTARPSRWRTAGLMVVTRLLALGMLVVAVVAFGAPRVLTLALPLVFGILVVVGWYAWCLAGLTKARWVGALVQAVPVAWVVAATMPITS